MVLVQAAGHTRTTLANWNREPWPVFRVWFVWAVATALALLGATWLVSVLVPPDISILHYPGVTRDAEIDDVGRILFGNSFVLALHASACVAGFIAGSSLPASAQRYSGLWRKIHDAAGPIAIAWVSACTIFSLITQAYVLGSRAATLSVQFDVPQWELLLALFPHAVPELAALFLPLAAWVIASRRGDWHELLAATVVTVAIAIPVLVASAFVEVYFSPELVKAIS